MQAPASPQARYQARRRQASRSVTFFPKERESLQAAVARSGKTQEAWLNEAIREKIDRQIEVMASAAVREFASCFWNVRLTGDVSRDLPLILDRLRKHGGMTGWRLASDLLLLAGTERTQWR